MLELHKESHLDHGLSEQHVAWILSLGQDWAEFRMDTFEIPQNLPALPCNLHGPATGEPPVGESEVIYEPRPPRTYPSRLCARGPVLVRTVTVVAGPHDGRQCVLYTAYPGAPAPREPGDPELPEAGRAEAEAFWAQHALGI